MTKMQELYEKVSAESTLQEKFAEIMKEAEKVGEKATKEKLIGFAKDAGYEITLDEMNAFFAKQDSKEGSLSDAELDMVAGGKSEQGQGMVWNSIMTFGGGCALVSVMAAAVSGGDQCARAFK